MTNDPVVTHSLGPRRPATSVIAVVAAVVAAVPVAFLGMSSAAMGALLVR